MHWLIFAIRKTSPKRLDPPTVDYTQRDRPDSRYWTS